MAEERTRRAGEPTRQEQTPPKEIAATRRPRQPAAIGAPDVSGTRAARRRVRSTVTGQTRDGQQPRRPLKRVKRPWWRGPLPLVGVVAAVMVAIVVFIVAANQGGSEGPIGQIVPTSLVREVTAVSPSIISAVGTGGLPTPLRAISGPTLTSGGKPEVLYIGAEFCPYCAANRWSLVNALSRFGTFSNLHYMRSATTDGDIATFTFHGGSTYTSKYVTFLPIENEDRGSNILQTMTAAQQELFSTLGNNGFPFLDFAGKYANGASNTSAGGFDPNILSGADWSKIAAALKNANDPITRAVIGNANYETAAICRLTHNQPARSCKVPTIRTIQQQLAQ